MLYPLSYEGRAQTGNYRGAVGNDKEKRRCIQPALASAHAGKYCGYNS